MAVMAMRARLRARARAERVAWRSWVNRRSASIRDVGGSPRARARTPAMTPASAATTNTKTMTARARRNTPAQLSLSTLLPHLPSRFAADGAGRHPGHRRALRHVLRHHRPGARPGAAAQPHRRHQHRVAADEGAVAADGHALPLAVVVAGHRAGADVDLLADLGVADVAEVAHLRAAPQSRSLHLHEVADVHACLQAAARPQVAERPNVDAARENGAFDDGRHDRTPVADLRVGDDGVRADGAGGADDGAAADRREH